MLKESGRVVAVDEDGLWVETLKTSTCAKCVAKAGCGQNLAAKLTPSQNMTLIKAFFINASESENPNEQSESERWQVGDTAIIGVAENALLLAALCAYGVPLLLMMLGVLGAKFIPLGVSSDLQTALGAAIGLVCGGIVVHLWSKRRKNDGFFQAHVLDHAIATSA